MSEYYGTVKGTILRSGIEAVDIPFEEEEGKTNQEVFEEYVQDFLVKATDYINFYVNNNFLEEQDRSPIIDDIAERIGSRMLNVATRDQTNQITNVEDFNVQLLDDIILTDAIKKDLDLLPSSDKKVEGRGSIDVAIVKDEDDFDFYLDLDLEE